MIKNAASQLFEEVEGFNEDFENNKKLLIGTMSSKWVRNRVAGGLVRLAKKKRQKESGELRKRKEQDDGQQENSE